MIVHIILDVYMMLCILMNTIFHIVHYFKYGNPPNIENSIFNDILKDLYSVRKHYKLFEKYIFGLKRDFNSILFLLFLFNSINYFIIKRN